MIRTDCKTAKTNAATVPSSMSFYIYGVTFFFFFFLLTARRPTREFLRGGTE
jgi:hypothetical protein